MLLFACAPNCQAQRVAEIDRYLNPIISKIAADPNGGGWAWETNRNGGYLLRTFIDVTGDGQPELFIATTLQGTRHKQSWAAFEILASGTMRPYNKVLEYASAWPATEEGQTYLLYVGAPDKERLKTSDESPYPVYRFAFTFPEIKETTSYVSEDEAAKLNLNLDQAPKLEAILLSDYLTEPNAKWSEVIEWKLDGNDCFFREEDKQRAEKNTAFTPQVALSLLGVQPSSPKARPPKPEEQESAPKNSSATQPSTAPGDIRVSLILLSILAMGIAIAAVFAWRLIKRRK